MSKTVFETLSKIDVNDKVEKKKNLTYLSWTWAWSEVKKQYPSASYRIIKDELTGQPWTGTPTLGYMVQTEVTIDGETLPMWLPVMDATNRSMKDEKYDWETKYSSGTVDVASTFDINKAIMRCLVKNLAMFGLGLYIYAGEDLPEGGEQTTDEAPKPAEKLKLEVGDDNWKRASAWVVANKDKGAPEILKTLRGKYSIAKGVEGEIKKLLK